MAKEIVSEIFKDERLILREEKEKNELRTERKKRDRNKVIRRYD